MCAVSSQAKARIRGWAVNLSVVETRVPGRGGIPLYIQKTRLPTNSSNVSTTRQHMWALGRIRLAGGLKHWRIRSPIDASASHFLDCRNGLPKSLSMLPCAFHLRPGLSNRLLEILSRASADRCPPGFADALWPRVPAESLELAAVGLPKTPMTIEAGIPHEPSCPLEVGFEWLSGRGCADDDTDSCLYGGGLSDDLYAGSIVLVVLLLLIISGAGAGSRSAFASDLSSLFPMLPRRRECFGIAGVMTPCTRSGSCEV